MMKKIFGSIWREADNATFQQRAIKKADKIAQGEKVIAPKHPTDDRVVKEALRNKQIRQELDTKHERLVDQVNRINIAASPPDPVTSVPDKDSLETPHNSTYDLNRFEYGIYELPLHKLTKNHLSFREALEVLRARVEIDPESEHKIDLEASSSSANLLMNHPAVKRVDADRLDNMYRYFRPFIRKDKQRVVMRAYLEGIRDVAEGKHDPLAFAGSPSKIIKELLVAKKLKSESIEAERYNFMEDEKQSQMVKAIQSRQQEEHDWLQKQMKEEFQKLEKESERKRLPPSEAQSSGTTEEKDAKKSEPR